MAFLTITKLIKWVLLRLPIVFGRYFFYCSDVLKWGFNKLVSCKHFLCCSFCKRLYRLWIFRQWNLEMNTMHNILQNHNVRMDSLHVCQSARMSFAEYCHIVMYPFKQNCSALHISLAFTLYPGWPFIWDLGSEYLKKLSHFSKQSVSSTEWLCLALSDCILLYIQFLRGFSHGWSPLWNWTSFTLSYFDFQCTHFLRGSWVIFYLMWNLIVLYQQSWMITEYRKQINM